MRLNFTTKILTYLLTIGLSVFVVSCSSERLRNFDLTKSDSTANEKLEVEEHMFQEINKRLKKSEILPLSEKEMRSEETEIRIWAGFDSLPLRGIILRQISEDSREALYIIPLKNRNIIKWENGNNVRVKEVNTVVETTRLLPKPKSEWDGIWEKLTELKIKTLPDWREIGLQPVKLDGTSVIVEIKTKEKYRSYGSFGFDYYKDKRQVRNVSEFCKLLEKEFNIVLIST